MPENNNRPYGDNKSLAFSSSLLLSGISILVLTYGIPREETTNLLIVYFIALASYISVFYYAKTHRLIQAGFIGALVIRILLLPAIPSLSDDYFRFIWDGLLFTNGINPFIALPSQIINEAAINIPQIDKELFNNLNSPEYFSIYPPVCQFIFAVATYLFPDSRLGSVIIMRLFMIAAEAGSLYCLLQLFKIYGIPLKSGLLYALNPLVILELTGNLHFEGVMIFLVLAAILAYKKNKIFLAGILFALAVSTKLLPLIFLPLFLRRLPVKQWFNFYGTIGIGTLLLFTPFLSEAFLNGLQNSLGLYFQKFEFNASIYYIIREIGFYVKGYNIINTAGKWLAVITFLSVIGFTIFERKNILPAAFLWVWCIYLLFATTVHPWYITPVIAFACFSGYYQFVILWSLMIFGTYMAYGNQPYEENLAVVVIEYLSVFSLLIVKLLQKKPLNSYEVS